MGIRRQARELVLKVLFHIEYNPGDPDEAFELICEHFGASIETRSFAKELILGICENIKDIDETISKASRNWRLERMSHVDRNLLRIGAFEIIYREDIPPKVSINEAVELGKKYGQVDSAAFVNGILDNIFKRAQAVIKSGNSIDKECKLDIQTNGGHDIL